MLVNSLNNVLFSKRHYRIGTLNVWWVCIKSFKYFVRTHLSQDRSEFPCCYLYVFISKAGPKAMHIANNGEFLKMQKRLCEINAPSTQKTPFSVEYTGEFYTHRVSLYMCFLSISLTHTVFKGDRMGHCG